MLPFMLMRTLRQSVRMPTTDMGVLGRMTYCPTAGEGAAQDCKLSRLRAEKHHFEGLSYADRG